MNTSMPTIPTKFGKTHIIKNLASLHFNITIYRSYYIISTVRNHKKSVITFRLCTPAAPVRTSVRRSFDIRNTCIGQPPKRFARRSSPRFSTSDRSKRRDTIAANLLRHIRLVSSPPLRMSLSVRRDVTLRDSQIHASFVALRRPNGDRSTQLF